MLPLRPIAAACGLLGAIVLLPTHADDPALVLGPETCGQCHQQESRVWKSTRHHSHYRELHRMPEAQEIVSKLGLRKVRGNDRCTPCHYTMQETERGPRAIAAVSCESCHGASRHWIDHHFDFGSPSATRATETDEHRERRQSTLDAAGMVRPGRIYELAHRCQSCHGMIDPELVEVGGHPAGGSFDLLSASQGAIRHNYRRSDDGRHNEEASLPERRRLFLVGQAVEFEIALKGLARSTGPGPYHRAMQARLTAARNNLTSIARTIDSPDLEAILSIPHRIDPSDLDDRPGIDRATEVAHRARAIADLPPGRLMGLDPLLPRRYLGSSQP